MPFVPLAFELFNFVLLFVQLKYMRAFIRESVKKTKNKNKKTMN